MVSRILAGPIRSHKPSAYNYSLESDVFNFGMTTNSDVDQYCRIGARLKHTGMSCKLRAGTEPDSQHNVP